MAARDFAALARGGGGTAAVRTLVAARRSRTLQLIRLVAGTQDTVAREAYRVLGDVRRVAPHAVDRVLDHPSVGAWATWAALRLTGDGQVHTGPLAGIAAAAAVRGRIAATLRAPPVDELALPSLGVAARPADELVVRPGPRGTDLGGGVRIPADWSTDGPGWRAVPRITVTCDGVRARFLLDRWEREETPADLVPADDPELPAWRAMLAGAWELLVRGHREVADELAAAVSVLTPLRNTPAGSSSATVADAFGCILLSIGPDAESMAVSLAHELRHNKLVALLDLFPLLDPVPGERFYAPWRDDPRPLLGLLHGTYAYVGVTDFWRRQRAREDSAAAAANAHTEFARWRTATLAATRTLLDSGRLTPTGRRFVMVMAETLERWCAEPVPVAATAAAERLSAEHRDSWRATHGRPD